MGVFSPFRKMARKAGAIPPGATVGVDFFPAGTNLPPPLDSGDPNPKRFAIQRTFVHGDFVVAEIHYPDAKNFEGRKICVYRARLADIACAKVLDPHFAEKAGPAVPIARFAPTESGWRMAQKFVRGIR